MTHSDEKIKTCAVVRITDVDGQLIETLRIPIELMTGTFANPFSVGVSAQLFQKLESYFLEIYQVYNDVENTIF